MTLMRTRHILIALVATIAVVSAACTSSGTPDAPSTPASLELRIAPHFTVPTADGGEFSLAEHLASDGRPVFLNLWASWCFPCREEMPGIDRASHEFPEIVFIGVAVQDSRPDAEKFANEINVTYIIAFDDEDQVDDAYAPFGLPASYIISSDGVILERIFGKITEEDIAEKLREHFGI